jgi:hypothetical protein
MKKAIAFLLLLILTSVLAQATMAQQPTQPNWRIYLRVTDQAYTHSLGDMTIGVNSGATDGRDSYYDSSAAPAIALPPTNMAAIVSVEDAEALAWDIKGPKIPLDPQYNASDNRKVWSLRVAGMGDADVNHPSVLFMKCVSSQAGIPPLTLPYVANGVTHQADVRYWLKMTDNKGVAGAPANGTMWSIPMPTVLTTSSFFTITLPTFNVSVTHSAAALIDEGYQMEFYQEMGDPSRVVAPEPGSLVALAGGIMGLAGCALRRRRS